jgi:Alpha/beta hydrolase domain
VKDGTPPPSLPKIDIQGSPRAIQRDQYGNALAGIRLPEMNVPIARYVPTGLSNLTGIGALLCTLAGAVYDWTNGAEPPGTLPGNVFPQPSLKALYRNHGAYVSAFVHAARDAVEARYLLEVDAQSSIEQAATSTVGK